MGEGKIAHCLRLFVFALAAALTLGAWLGRWFLLAVLFWRRLSRRLRLRLRRFGYSLTLRSRLLLSFGLGLLLLSFALRLLLLSFALRLLLLRLALGLLLSGLPSGLLCLLLRLLSGRLSASCLLLRASLLLLSGRLSTSIFSLLLLNLTRLLLSILIIFFGFGGHAAHVLFLVLIHFRFARRICLLFLLALVINLELLISGRVGNRFYAQCLCRVPAKLRLFDIAANKYARVVKFLGNARRQIDFAAAPGGMYHCVSQRSQGQRIER